jgi:serine/threonine protein kinase
MIPPDDLAALLGGNRTVTMPPGGNVADLYFVTEGGATTAVKVMRPDIPVDRADRELAALQRLTHPGIARFVGHGTLDYLGQQYRYIAMERVEGERLTDRLAQINQQPLGDRIALITRMLEALEALDAQHVVHRDIKPDNIIIKSDGTPVLVDLGWARLTDQTTITVVGQRTGSLAYNSPEQYRGDPVDGRSDLFALGIVAYKILIGRHPFWSEQNNEPPDWAAHAQGRPLVGLLTDPAITDEIADVVDSLLDADPANRPASGRIAAENLAAAIGGSRPALDIFPRSVFLANIAHLKAHLETGFFGIASIDGVVLELRVNGAGTSQAHLQRGVTKHRLVDPSSPLSFWTQQQQRGGYASHHLPHSAASALLRVPATADAFVTPFMDLQRSLGVTEYVAPYVYATAGHVDDVELSMELAELAATKSGGAPVLAGVALEGAILMDSAARQRVVRALTGTRVPGFYVLVEDGRGDFRQLDHEDLLRGIRELTKSLRRARKAVVYGRVGSVGLCTLVAGAAGFSTGVEAKGMHYGPEDPSPPGGGGGATVERYYSRGTFGFLRAAELRAGLSVIDQSTGAPPLTACVCPFCTGSPAMFMSGGPWNDEIASRHFLWCLAADTAEIGALRLGARRAWLANRLLRASATRDAMLRVGIRLELESRTPSFDVWERVFC